MPPCCGRDTPDWRTPRALPVSTPRSMQKLHMTRSAASPRRCASAWHDEVSRTHVEVLARAAAEFVSFTKACPGMRKPAAAGNGGVAHGVRPAVPVLRIRMGRTCRSATGVVQNAVPAGRSCTHFAAELRRKPRPTDIVRDSCAATRRGWRAWPVPSAPALIEASRVGLWRSAMHNARTCTAPCMCGPCTTRPRRQYSHAAGFDA